MRLGGIGTGLIVAIAVAVPGRAGEDTPAKAWLKTIEAEQKAAVERYAAEVEKVEATADAQQLAFDRFLAKTGENVAAAFDLARANPEDPAAFEALKFVIRTNRAGPGDATARALRMILDRGDARAPSQGPYLAGIAITLFQYPDAERLLRRVLDENPSRDDRGAACYWLAHHLRQQARMVKRLREKPGVIKAYEKYTAAAPIDEFVKEKDPDALDKAAVALLERVVAEFGDVRMEGESRTLAATAGGELFALRNLGVGRAAPEIQGADHEGKPFQLSDHRGKVVVLTFSGNWCGPCRGMYPQERALVAQLKDKPFALVSVDTDKEVATLQQSITSGEITWRCWWDGGTDGPITTRWGISSFPTLFVLDRHGVIRFQDVRGDDLDQAVAALLAEGESGPAGAR